MLRITKIKTSKDIDMRLGTAVEVLVSISEKTATVIIKIEDPSDAVKTDNVTMTRLNNYNYQYIYQSASTDDSGEYTITITATSNGVTAVSQTNFELISQ